MIFQWHSSKWDHSSMQMNDIHINLDFELNVHKPSSHLLGLISYNVQYLGFHIDKTNN
jgi:hypothetical protein